MFNPHPPDPPDARIDARVGIVSHSDAFTNFALVKNLEQLFTRVGAPMDPAADMSAYVGRFDLVFLEANYGTAGGKLAFEPAFFAEHPQVKFYLYYGAGVDPGALTPWPENVLGSVVKPLNVEKLQRSANRYALQQLPSRGDIGPDVLSPEEFGAGEPKGKQHGRDGHGGPEGERPRELGRSKEGGPKTHSESPPPRVRPRPHGV